MNKSDYGFIMLYIAAFGFSDYFVECFKLKGINYLIFYSLILVLGLFIVFGDDKIEDE